MSDVSAVARFEAMRCFRPSRDGNTAALMMGVMIHSVPAEVQRDPCQTVSRAPDPRLRPYVVGYSGFRSGPGVPLAHRLFPTSLTTMIIDFSGTGLVTGPRSVASIEPTRWGYGMAIGLTPAGVRSVLGLPAADLAGANVGLAQLPEAGAARLVERLATAPTWPDRFALLDEYLMARCGADDAPDGLAMRAWRRLHGPTSAVRIGALAAELGVARRTLEATFRNQVGLPPATAARIGRFQRAISMLARNCELSRTAAECGYADQPHFTRGVRAMTGLTPTELRAFLHDAVRGAR